MDKQTNSGKNITSLVEVIKLRPGQLNARGEGLGLVRCTNYCYATAIMQTIDFLQQKIMGSKFQKLF